MARSKEAMTKFRFIPSMPLRLDDLTTPTLSRFMQTLLLDTKRSPLLQTRGADNVPLRGPEQNSGYCTKKAHEALRTGPLEVRFQAKDWGCLTSG